MKRKLLICALLLIFGGMAWAADVLLKNLTALTGAGVDSANDVLLINDASANTDKKITAAQLRIGIGAQPLHANLTALAGLTYTQNTFPLRAASGSGVPDKAIAVGSDFSLSGDVLSLANSYYIPGGNAGTPSGIVLTNGTGLPFAALTGEANKPPVYVVATDALTLSGEQTIDGFLTSASIVLCTNQGDATANGFYITDASGWSRPTWWATGSVHSLGALTKVLHGTNHGGSSWYVAGSITVDTTSQSWSELDLSATTMNVATINAGSLLYTEAAAPGTPASGKVALYAKADGLLYSKDDAGTETLVSGGSGGAATAWDAIGDAGGDGTIALGAHETDFTSTIDAAGEAIWTITNTDSDAANDNSFLDLKHNDGADTNVFYMRMIGDADGTPTNDYLFSQTGLIAALPFTTTYLVLTGSTVPANGIYLPAANTLGWAVNSAAEMQLTSTALSPAADDGSSLGTTALGWNSLFGDTGFVLNIENANWRATHTSGILTVDAGELRITSANVGTNADSVPTQGSTTAWTGKTLDASATGNVVKLKNYIYLNHPHLADGTNATIGTTATAIGYGHATFSNSVDKASNYVEYYLQVPEDLDTSVALRARVKILLGNTDTGKQGFRISSVSVADSAVPTSSTLANEISINFAGDASGANGDVETSSWTTLTSWAGALTAGQTWRIRLARDGDDGTDDTSTVNCTELGLVIEYGMSQ